MIMLTPRLEQVAKLVLPGRIVADIGTDHAYIPIFLIQSGVTPQAIATDIHHGPYEIARDKVKAYLLEDKIEVRKGNGLIPVREKEAQVAVIAGMGGLTIKNILQQSPQVVESLEQLILQPMMAAEEVRKWLAGNGWKLAGEVLIKEEDRYYQIINAIKGEQLWPEDENSLEWQLGPTLVAKGDRLLLEYINRLIDINCGLSNELKYLDTPKGKLRTAELLRQIRELEELRRRCRLNANN